MTFIFISPLSSAQYEHCGNDYNCYYETKAEIQEEIREEEEAEEEAYRTKQLELQRKELEAVRNQNQLIEKSLDDRPPEAAQ